MNEIALTLMINGKETKIGTASLSEDGESIDIVEIDPAYRDLLEGNIRQFMIAHPEEPVRHNVFDKEKE